MKLKEKLAKDVVKFNTPGNYQHEAEMKAWLSGIELGFVIGFDKAKILAIEKLNEYWFGRTWEFYFGKQRQSHDSYGLGGKILDQLGEEDV